MMQEVEYLSSFISYIAGPADKGLGYSSGYSSMFLVREGCVFEGETSECIIQTNGASKKWAFRGI